MLTLSIDFQQHHDDARLAARIRSKKNYYLRPSGKTGVMTPFITFSCLSKEVLFFCYIYSSLFSSSWSSTIKVKYSERRADDDDDILEATKERRVEFSAHLPSLSRSNLINDDFMSHIIIH